MAGGAAAAAHRRCRQCRHSTALPDASADAPVASRHRHRRQLRRRHLRSGKLSATAQNSTSPFASHSVFSSSSTDNATADRSKISPSSKIMVVMSEDNSNTAPPHPSVAGSNPAATAFSVRNWYDQHQVHQQANHHSYFSQVPAQYSNGKKRCN